VIEEMGLMLAGCVPSVSQGPRCVFCLMHLTGGVSAARLLHVEA
jgi:hypothetical protein